VAQPFLAVKTQKPISGTAISGCALRISKQRNNPTDTVRFVFRSRLTRFEEAAPDAFSQFSPDDL